MDTRTLTHACSHIMRARLMCKTSKACMMDDHCVTQTDIHAQFDTSRYAHVLTQTASVRLACKTT
jgi:hypothetical protein